MELLLQGFLNDEPWGRIVGPTVGATITGFVALLIWWLNRKRPNRVEVREIELTSLLRVADTIRPRITATLDGHRIAKLSQMEVAITNASAETLRDISLTFRFPGETRVLECEISGTSGDHNIGSSAELTVSIPFLNAHRHHGDVVTAKILCDGNAEAFTVLGRGDGWSVWRTTIDSVIRARMAVGLVASVTLLIATLLYMRWLRAAFGVTGDELSSRALAGLLPAIVLVSAGQYLIMRWLRRSIRRLRR
jgi:hypothetical protein